MNQKFFAEVWPKIAAAVTGHRADAHADIFPLLRRLAVRRDARVLDAPCGYGRHAVALAKRGYRVTGVDISPVLLKQAREAARAAGVDADFRRGDLRRMEFRGQFGLALNLFTSFGYFGDEEDAQVVRNFYRALKPRGWLVIHVINRDYVIRNYQPRRKARMKGFTLEESGEMDFASSLVRTVWVARPSAAADGGRALRAETTIRMYSPHELAAMLRAAGFRDVCVYGGFRGEPVSFDRRWMVVCGRK